VESKKGTIRRVKRYWELIADNLSASGWTWGCVATIDCSARTIFVADAHRDDGKRFVVRSEEKRFLSLNELPANHRASKMPNNSARFPPCSLLRAFPWEGQEMDCKMQSNSR
jgi:hypothetical protein